MELHISPEKKNWAEELVIGADNQAALQTLKSGNLTNYEYAQDALHHIAERETRNHNSSGIWTPAHCGISGNEQANTEAKAGTRTSPYITQC